MSALATRLPSAGTLAAGLAVALVVIAALVVVMRRHRDAFPLLAVLTLPFRLPISTDGRTVNLLIPLYLVVAAGTLTYLLPRLLASEPGRGAAARRAVRRRTKPPPRPRARAGGPRRGAWNCCWLITVALYALQTLYSSDRAKAAENIAFFYVPFALLFLILRDVRWTRELLLRCLGVAVALAVLFAGVGFVEYDRKPLFLNPKVVAANQYDNYFRVNSVFFDPSIYGRFLALVMIAVMTLVLARSQAADGFAACAARAPPPSARRGGRARVAARGPGDELLAVEHRRAAAGPGGARRVVLGRAPRRSTFRVALLALAAAIVLLAPASLHFGLKGSSGSASNATSGRTTLISRRPRTVRQTAAGGLRLGLVRNRVQTAQRGRRGERRERHLGLAHDPRDDRRGAGDRRAGGVRRAAGRGVRGPLPRRRALAAADRDRGVLCGARAAHVDVRRLPRGPVHVDAVGAWHGPGPPGAGRRRVRRGRGRGRRGGHSV